MISSYAKSYSSGDESKILAITAMIIGGVAVGRALNDNDTTEKLLESCKTVTQMLLDGT